MKRTIRLGWLCLAVLVVLCWQIPAAEPAPVSQPASKTTAKPAPKSATKAKAASKPAPKPTPAAEPPKDYVWPVGELTRYTPTAEEVLKAPAGVQGDFDVARTAPVIDFTIMPGQWLGAKLWSNWGNSLYGSDGSFYCTIGDHMAPHGNAYLYKVDPAKRTVQMVVDYSKVVGVPVKEYTPGKIHGPLMDGGDGWIYFIGYRGGAGTDDEHAYKGDWMLRCQVATGKVENLGIPVPFCGVPTSVISPATKLLCGLGAQGKNSPYKHSPFFAYDLAAGKLRLIDESVAPNLSRAVLLADDGRAFYSTGTNPRAPRNPPAKKAAKGKPAAPAEAEEEEPPATKPAVPLPPHHMVRYDPKTNKIETLAALLPGNGELRAASRPDRNGVAYCITSDGVIFAFDTKTETVTREINKTFVAGPLYTGVCVLSPDGRYLYYAPSSHGKARQNGAAILQLDVQTGRRKVLAFLYDYFGKQQNGYCIGGTFGIALSEDGGTLFTCHNGTYDKSQSMEFGLCSVVVLHIPPSERQ